MIIKYYMLLFYFVVFIPGPVCYGFATGEIAGFFFLDKAKSPLPGALIALYDADNNLLIDYTYTIDNGQFWLKPPKAKGKFYIVATKGLFSQKTEIFEYGPQKPLKNIMIQYPKSKNDFAKIRGYIWNKFNYLITILIGLLVGLGFKWIGDRKKAKRDFEKYIFKIKNSAKNILHERDELLKIFKDQNKREKIGEYYQNIKGKMEKHIEDLEKQLSPEIYLEVPYLKDKKDARKAYDSFYGVIREIRSFTNRDQKLIINASDRNMQMQPFRELENKLKKNNPLLNDCEQH